MPALSDMHVSPPTMGRRPAWKGLSPPDAQALDWGAAKLANWCSVPCFCALRLYPFAHSSCQSRD